MEFSPFCPGNRLRTPIIKAVAMVKTDSGEEFHHRPLRLRTLVTRYLAKLLDRPASPQELRAALHHLPASLRMDIFKRIRGNNEMIRSRFSVKENVFHAWLALFSDTELVLEEFLGDHWSRLVFDHMVQGVRVSHRLEDPAEPLVQEEKQLQAVTRLTLASREVNQERLCFLFELTESTWKPNLRTFLSRLPNLTHLTLSDFCDDDTVSIVGQHCPVLQYLCISLGPESFSEQQLSDDGFSDLIENQLGRLSLREVDISDCYTSAVTAKTILNFSKLSSVSRLHVMWSHFIWIDLSIRFLGADFAQNRFVKLLSIKFGHDSFENSRYFNTDQGAINFISKVFPDLQELRVHNLFELDTQEEIDKLRETFGGIIKQVSMKKCRDLSLVASMVPRVERLELGIVMSPEAKHVKFPHLTHLTVNKDMFAIDFNLIHDLLANCVSILVFKVYSLKLSHYSEDRFVHLFVSQPHLSRLQQLSLNFRSCSPVTARLVHCLAQTCPNLQRLDNLLSWNLHGLDPALLAEAGRTLVMAKKSHWSLPWRSEDGQFHDVDAGQGGGCVMDLYDNR